MNVTLKQGTELTEFSSRFCWIHRHQNYIHSQELDSESVVYSHKYMAYTCDFRQ